MTTRLGLPEPAPRTTAPSLDTLRQACADAVRDWHRAIQSGAGPERVAELEWEYESRYREFSEQDRRIKLAIAGDRGWWL